jgi:NTP pyrophosphatase (non-canonical NTP hydrolase)
MLRSEVFAAVDSERRRQHTLWMRDHEWGFGDCSSDTVPELVKMAVLTEEVGEVSRAILDRSSQARLREELVQVAAVAVAWLECLDASARG